MISLQALSFNKGNFKAQINTVVMVIAGSFCYDRKNFKAGIKRGTFRQTFG
jgi:hypothetical protein